MDSWSYLHGLIGSDIDGVVISLADGTNITASATLCMRLSQLQDSGAMTDEQLASVPDVETPLVRTAPAPLYLLSRLTRQQGIRVVLTGEGCYPNQPVVVGVGGGSVGAIEGRPNGFFIVKEGWEYNLVLAASLIYVAILFAVAFIWVGRKSMAAKTR